MECGGFTRSLKVTFKQHSSSLCFVARLIDRKDAIYAKGSSDGLHAFPKLLVQLYRIQLSSRFQGHFNPLSPSSANIEGAKKQHMLESKYLIETHHQLAV